MSFTIPIGQKGQITPAVAHKLPGMKTLIQEEFWAMAHYISCLGYTMRSYKQQAAFRAGADNRLESNDTELISHYAKRKYQLIAWLPGTPAMRMYTVAAYLKTSVHELLRAALELPPIAIEGNIVTLNLCYESKIPLPSHPIFRLEGIEFLSVAHSGESEGILPASLLLKHTQDRLSFIPEELVAAIWPIRDGACEQAVLSNELAPENTFNLIYATRETDSETVTAQDLWEHFTRIIEHVS